MPDWKELYLHMFRESEKAKNIIIDAQRLCEELYITAPEHELRVLKPGEDESHIRTTNMPDYRELYYQLFRETQKTVLVLMRAQTECDGRSIEDMDPEILLTPGLANFRVDQDKSDENEQKESQT